jgi:hypothetical protein
MASLGIPLLESAVTALLVALGIKTASDASRQSGKKRDEEASDARTKPIAKTDAPAKADTKCADCPADRGAVFPRSTAGWSALSIAYQMRIGGMPPAAPGFITEWLYGITFDGFSSPECLLKEAKAAYDQFFTEYRVPKGWWAGGADDMIAEAMRQGAAAQPRPPVRLRWHFMEPVSYRYFSQIINAAYPDVEVVFQP